MRLQVDQTLCTGHGRCYGTAPSLFEPIDAEGTSRAQVSILDPGDARIESASIAARACPEEAIVLDEP